MKERKLSKFSRVNIKTNSGENTKSKKRNKIHLLFTFFDFLPFLETFKKLQLLFPGLESFSKDKIDFSVEELSKKHRRERESSKDLHCDSFLERNVTLFIFQEVGLSFKFLFRVFSSFSDSMRVFRQSSFRICIKRAKCSSVNSISEDDSR